MIYALIKNGKVKNKVVGDDIYAESIKDNWDFVLRVDNITAPVEIDFSYDGTEFTAYEGYYPPEPLPPTQAELDKQAAKDALKELKDDKDKIDTSSSALKETIGQILEVLNL